MMCCYHFLDNLYLFHQICIKKVCSNNVIKNNLARKFTSISLLLTQKIMLVVCQKISGYRVVYKVFNMVLCT